MRNAVSDKPGRCQKVVYRKKKKHVQAPKRKEKREVPRRIRSTAR